MELFFLDLEVWKAARSVDSSTDFVVPPDFQSEIGSLLQDAGISFNVSISDLQHAIANENPVAEDDDLVNRSRKVSLRILLALHCFHIRRPCTVNDAVTALQYNNTLLN